MFNWLRSLISEKHDEPITYPLMPRTVNISGTIFRFSMPENFSLDMPGDDLVEQVDLAKCSGLSESGAIQLVKRWWDFYHGKPSAKNIIGTMMLSLDIMPRKVAIDGSLFDHAPMVNTFYRDLLSDFSVSSPEDAMKDGAVLPESAGKLSEFSNNGRNWVIAGVGFVDKDSNRVNFYGTPISDDWYLRARFSLSSGGGKNSGPFLRRAIDEQLRILESFQLTFPREVPERIPVELSMYK